MKVHGTRRYAVWTIWASLIMLVAYMLLRPSAIEVDITTVDAGDIEYVLKCEGRVRVMSKRLVSMPVTGIYRPASLNAGDMVSKLALLGEYRVVELDQRTIRELYQREMATAKARDAIREQRGTIDLQVQQAAIDRDRAQRLYAQGVMAKAEWERALLHYEQLQRELRATDLTLERMEHEQAVYRTGSKSSHTRGLQIRSEISGVVLRRFVDDERILGAGTPLYEIGTFDSVEVTTDVLSTDAAGLSVGMLAIINANSTSPVAAEITRIEPAAFTKVSALGIEEQRVLVACKPSQKIHLGDGYRVALDVVVWRNRDVVRIPSNAISIDGKDTAVYQVVNGAAFRKSVRLGVRGRDFVQVLHGIEKGTLVVVNPPTSLRNGSNVIKADYTN